MATWMLGHGKTYHHMGLNFGPLGYEPTRCRFATMLANLLYYNIILTRLLAFLFKIFDKTSEYSIACVLMRII